MTYYILYYLDGGACWARGGYYEFYPFTLRSLWPARALPLLRKKAARCGGWIETVTID